MCVGTAMCATWLCICNKVFPSTPGQPPAGLPPGGSIPMMTSLPKTMMMMTDPPGAGPQKARELQLSEEELRTMTLLMTTRRRKRRGRPGGAGELCQTMIMKKSRKRSPANGPEGREVAGALHLTMILTARKSDQRGGRWPDGRGRGCRMRMKTTTR